MRKFKLVCHVIVLLLIAILTSCKTNGIILPMNSSSRLNAISKLPESQKIQPQEMTNWYAANLQSSIVLPLWDKTMQTIFNGDHVIEVPTGAESALFFTKTNGILSVDAYRWQNKTPGRLPFTGNIICYSFEKNKILGSIYNQGVIIKTGIMNVPASAPLSQFFDQLTLGDVWNMYQVKK